MNWQWLENGSRFHVFQPCWMAETEKKYLIVYEFDECWDLRVCVKAGEGWCGGSYRSINAATPEEMITYAEEHYGNLYKTSV